MSTADTTLRVLTWALGDTSGAPPRGDLSQAARLAAPGHAVVTAVGRLAAVTAARLRLRPPPLGDIRPPGLGAAALAAAVGGRDHDRACQELTTAAPTARLGYDLMAYHGLVARVLPHVRTLGAVLRDRSPLTGVLDHPGPAASADCEDLVERMLDDPWASRLLTLTFATPPESGAQDEWRGETLAWLRHTRPDVVVDVYETALVHFRVEHEVRTRAAWRAVLAGTPAPARPVAAWWRALAELELAEPDRLRARGRLVDYQSGVKLFRNLARLGDA